MLSLAAAFIARPCPEFGEVQRWPEEMAEEQSGDVDAVMDEHAPMRHGCGARLPKEADASQWAAERALHASQVACGSHGRKPPIRT